MQRSRWSSPRRLLYRHFGKRFSLLSPNTQLGLFLIAALFVHESLAVSLVNLWKWGLSLVFALLALVNRAGLG